jgi:soluble lytic murein transglycosylase-like protein
VDLPPIPDQDWRQHQVQLFSESSAKMIAPFEEAERARAYRDLQSAQFAASSQALQQDLSARLAADQVSRFNQGSAPIAEAVAKLTAPPVPPSLPTAKDLVGAVGQAAGDLVGYARRAALKAGIDPDLFVRQINQESGFDPKAGSPAGAQGIAQIVPKYHPNVNPWDPQAALDYAANLMKSHLDTYRNYREALAAYNGGHGAVQQLRAGTPYDETRRYLGAILSGPEPALPRPEGTRPTTQEAAEPSIPSNPASVTTPSPLGAPAPESGQFQGGKPPDAFGRYLGPEGAAPLSSSFRSGAAPLTPADVLAGAPAGVSDVLEQGRAALERRIVANPYAKAAPDEGPYPGSLPPETDPFGPDSAGVNLALGISGGGLGKVASPAAGRLVGAAGEALTPLKGDTGAILNAAGEEIKRVAVKIPPAIREEFLQPEALMPAQAVPVVRRVFDRSRNVIASMGDAGAELADRIHAWREGAETDAAAFIQRMPTVKALGGSDFGNMVDVLEGNARPNSPRIARAAAEAKGVLDDVFSRAQNARVDVAERIGSYFPHTYTDDIISRITDTRKRADLIRHLMETNQAATPEEANTVLQRFVTASRDRRQGSLEMERLANLPGYEKTKEALYNHILSATRRINEVAQFGRDDAIADRLLTRIGAEGYELPVARDLFQTIVGAKSYGDLAQKVSGAARAYNAVTRLGLAAIGNATQSVNTVSVGGVLRTLQNTPKAVWSQAEKDFAQRAGVTLDAVIKEIREGGGWSDKIPGLAMAGFNEVEVFNRRLAALVGRDFAASMARRAAGTATGLERIGSTSGARRALEKMGLDAEAIVKRGGELSPQEEIRAARSMVERSQFKVDPQDLPGWASHPLGKLLMQFKTFSYNQTAFVKRELIDEARKGNVLPLVRFAILAPLAQAAATETRNALQGRPPEEDPGMRALQYALGPLGIAGDVARTVFGINSKYVPIERRTAQLTGSLLGPTVGAATEALGAGLNATEGNLTPAARFGLRQAPYAGPWLANTLTPYKQASPAPSGRPATTRTGTRDTRSGGTRRGTR